MTRTPRGPAGRQLPRAAVTHDPRGCPYVPPWLPPAPAALPGLRSALAAAITGPDQITGTATALMAGRPSILPPALTPRATAENLHHAEHRRLRAADLYLVSAEMTELAVTAGETLPQFCLEPGDLPAPTGFIVFCAPIGSYLSTDPELPGRIPVVAATWGTISYPAHPAGGLWLTYYTPTDFEGLEQLARQQGHRVDSSYRARLRTTFGPLTWDNECGIPYGAVRAFNYSRGDSHYGDPAVIAPWFQTISAAWQLMNQPGIAQTDTLPRPRAAARADSRQGISTSPVRIIRLREITGPPGPGTGRASPDYACRWLVRGHWRTHWFPRRQVHRPVWIAPHIKGPPGKPLRATDVVTVWDR